MLHDAGANVKEVERHEETSGERGGKWRRKTRKEEKK